MNLVLQGTALNDEPMSQPLIGRFDERGGTLGRSDSATFMARRTGERPNSRDAT